MPFKDPEKKRAYSREYAKTYSKTPKGKELVKRSAKLQKERVNRILSELKSIPCADCKQSFPPYVMDFDHLDPSTKLRGVAWLRSERAIREEAAKCEVVCANCHRIRTWEESYNGRTT